ncbi:MAG: DNA starvation/stationary phase protection protein [Chlamydiota bacterium]
MDTGMSSEERVAVGKKLLLLLADTYSIYLKTQNFHWNLKGEHFYSLHLLLQKLYEELAEAIDELAERIRALGQYVEAHFARFSADTCIAGEKHWTTSKDMVQQLTKDHEAIAKRHRPAIAFAEENHDAPTGDLIIQRIATHEKAAYLLRSHLQES